jgi:hypothetical protein
MIHAKTFGICAALAFAVSVPNIADAKFQRYSGAFCAVTSVPGGIGQSFSSLLNRLNDSTGIDGSVQHGIGTQQSFTCPIIDTDNFTHSQVRTLNVHGRNFSSGIPFRAKACFTTFNGDAGSCTAPQNGAGTTDAIASFVNASGVFSGAGSGDFVYLYVSTFNFNTTTGFIRGYFTADS